MFNKPFSKIFRLATENLFEAIVASPDHLIVLLILENSHKTSRRGPIGE